MQFSFVLIDESENSTATLDAIKNYEAFLCVAICSSKEEGMKKILELKPNIVFLSISNTSISQNQKGCTRLFWQIAFAWKIYSQCRQFFSSISCLLAMFMSKTMNETKIAMDFYQFPR